MKVAEGSEGLDVVALVEQQPALLLQAGAAVTSDETAAERLQVPGGRGLGWQYRAASCSGWPKPAGCGPVALAAHALKPDRRASPLCLLQAWQHGLVSDNSAEWARRYAELQAYVER